MSSHQYKLYPMGSNPIEETHLENGWKEELFSQGHATCIHQNCQLSFLSISGMVAHNKICPGFIRPSDFVSCIHCNAKFTQYKSCQTHMKNVHKELDEASDEVTERENNPVECKVAGGFSSPSPNNRYQRTYQRTEAGSSAVPSPLRRPHRSSIPPSPNVMSPRRQSIPSSPNVMSSRRQGIPPNPSPRRQSIPPNPNVILPDVILPNQSSPIHQSYSRTGQRHPSTVSSRRQSIASGNIIKARAADGKIHYFRAADPISPSQSEARLRREPQRLVLVEDDIRHLLPQHPLPRQSFNETQHLLPRQSFNETQHPLPRQSFTETQHPLPRQSFNETLPRQSFNETPAQIIHRSRQRLSTSFKPEFSHQEEHKPEVFISYGDHDYLPKSEFGESSRTSMGFATPSRFVAMKEEDSPSTRKERFLAAQEAKISELESMAAETELLANQSKKEKELAERENKLRKWEMELQRRENEARRRLADARMNLFDDTKAKIEKIEPQQRYVTTSHSGFSDLQNVILTREDLVSLHPNDRPINSVVLGPREQDTWSDSSTRSMRTATAPSPSMSELTDPDSVTSSINASTNHLVSRSLNSAASCYSDGEGSNPSYSPSPRGNRRMSPSIPHANRRMSPLSNTSMQIIPVNSRILPKMTLPPTTLHPADIIPINPTTFNSSSSVNITPLVSKPPQSFKITPMSFNIRPEPIPSPFNPRKPYESFNQIIKPVSSSSVSSLATVPAPSPSHSSVISSSSIESSSTHFPTSSHSTPKRSCGFPLEFKDDSRQLQDTSLQAPPVKRAKVHYPSTSTHKKPIPVPNTFKLPASAIRLQNAPNPQPQIANITPLNRTQPSPRSQILPKSPGLLSTRDYFHQASFSPSPSPGSPSISPSPLIRMPSFSPLEGGHFPTHQFLTPQPFERHPSPSCTPSDITSQQTSLTLSRTSEGTLPNPFPSSQADLQNTVRSLESSLASSSPVSQSIEPRLSNDQVQKTLLEAQPQQPIQLQEPRLPLLNNATPYVREPNLSNHQTSPESLFYSTQVQDCPVNLSKQKSPTNSIDNISTSVETNNIATNVGNRKNTERLDVQLQKIKNKITETEKEIPNADTENTSEVIVALGEEFNLDTNLVVNDGVKLECLLEQAAGGMLTLVAEPTSDGQYLILENSNQKNPNCPFIDASKGIDILNPKGLDVLIKCDVETEDETNTSNEKVDEDLPMQLSQSCDVEKLEQDLQILKANYSLGESSQSFLEPNSSQNSLLKESNPDLNMSNNESFSKKEMEEDFRIFRSKNDSCNKVTENPLDNSAYSFASDSESMSKVDGVNLKQGNVKHKKNSKFDLNQRSRTASFTEIAKGTFEDIEREIAKEVPEPSGDIVDYLEKRLKEFECDFTNMTSMDEDHVGNQSSQAADVESEPDTNLSTRKSHRIKRRSSKVLANAETASESEADHQVTPSRVVRRTQNLNSQKSEKSGASSPVIKEKDSTKSKRNKIGSPTVHMKNIPLEESSTNVKHSKRSEKKSKSKDKTLSPNKPPKKLKENIQNEDIVSPKISDTVVPGKLGFRRSSRSRKSKTIDEASMEEAPIEEVDEIPSRRSARISNSSSKQKNEQSDCEIESRKSKPIRKQNIELETPKPAKRQRQDSSENEISLSQRKKQKLKQKSKAKKLPRPKACGKCEEVLESNRDFKKHVASHHGGCARLKDDKDGQEFTKEQEAEAWQEAFNWISKVPCPRCLKVSYTTKPGMRYHVQTCNRTEAELEAIKVNCSEPNCDERLLPQNMKNHEAKHRNERRKILEQEKAIKTAVLSTTDSPGTRVKRQAAQKARKLFTELVQQMRKKIDDDDSQEDERDEEIISDDGDDDSYDVYEEISVATLYRSVRDISGARVVRCTVCTSEFDTKAKAETHIMTEHSAELLNDQGDDTDEDWSEANDDDLNLGSIQSNRPRRSTGSGAVRQRRLEPFSECVSTEAEYRRRNYFTNNFPRFGVVLSSWKPINPGKAATYLPAALTSARFTVRQARAKHPEVTEAENEIRMLERFSGGFINSSPMLFTGGPVWGMAWCPLPAQSTETQPSKSPSETESNQPVPDQFLAISSQLDMDSESPLHKTAGGPGLVQIWRCPGLDLTEGAAPVFSMGLAHHYGSVWCLEWCPSGMFDHPDADTRPSDGVRRRLGGLAAACSDGTVRIFTLPHPDNLQDGQIYLREADMTLQADQEGADLHGQCIKLSWYRGQGHNWIAGSFSSGVVGLWHITTTSPLLKTSSFILPTQAWLAHTSSVTGLSLSPYGGEDPRHLLTGSTDRCYKFWDLRDTAVPLQVVKRGMVTSVSWLPGWAAGTVSHDDVYLQSHTQTLVTESGYYTSRSQPVIAQNSGVWDESVSSWTGSLAAGTSAGELIVFVLPSLERSMEHDKICNQRRTYVFRTEVETEEVPPTADQQLYQTAKQFSKLGYVDIPVLSGGAGDCPTEEMRKVRSADRMGAENLVVYPLPSVNRVRWNNNMGSHLWLASGGQAGIVRIHNVRGLQSSDVKKAMEDIEHSV